MSRHGLRPARLAGLFASLLPALLLGGCGGTGTARGPSAAPGAGGSVSTADAATAEPGGEAPGASAPRSEGVMVTWEALAVEREQAENPRFGRRPQTGAVPTQKIILVNESHPEAARTKRGRTATTQNGITVAVVSDQDMGLLVRGFEQAGFFRHARDTTALETVFDKPDARGRVTLDRSGRSLSLVSMRGQGLQAGTKDVPAIYSQLKQTIAAMRNQTPTLNVSAAQPVGSARPR